MTSEHAPKRAQQWSGVLLIGVAAAAGAALAAARLVSTRGGDVLATWQAQSVVVSTIIIAPLLAAIAAAWIVRAGSSATNGAVAASSVADRSGVHPEPASKTEDAALQLLALLQQEGRFVDFIEEDLSAYGNEQIGAAVRAIHQGCRTALRDRLALAPVLAGDEGANVTIERGFDPAAVRVTGNVRGEPPYHGVLRHPGWRTTGLRLPERTAGRDASILAPAEVEVP